MTEVQFSRGPAGTWSTPDWPLSGHEVIPSGLLKSLRKRKNLPAFSRLFVHVAAITSSGLLLWELHQTLWALPLMAIFGCLIALLFAPLHECAHGTAFRTRWLNDLVGRITGFLVQRPFLYFRYRHTSHHTYTQHPQLDPDLVPLPKSRVHYVLDMSARGFWKMCVAYHWRGATGRFDSGDLFFMPLGELSRITREFRICVMGYALLIAATLQLDPLAPLVLIVGPRIFGEVLLRFLRMSEHTATDNSPNLLRNTRTTLVNPLLHFFYWEMPYHAEHHIAPSVPFHALFKLHGVVRSKIHFVSNRGIVGAHADILQAVARQHQPIGDS